MKNRERKHRYLMAFMGVMLMGMGAYDLLPGRAQDRNYWANLTFGPLAVSFGLWGVVSAFWYRKEDGNGE